MTIVRHDLRQGRTAFALWTAAIAFLLAICLLMFPQMKGQMEAVSKVFSLMGSFTAAFGMDRLNIGTLIGFYAVECGNVLGLGGAFFASLTGVSALAKEERDHTAELLLTHPLSRARIVSEKLAAVLIQVTAMDVIILGAALVSVKLIGETIPWKEMLLIHTANYLLQVELSCVCFGISAFLHRGGAGLGIGLAAAMYFLNLIANIADRTGTFKALKYITPFAYCEGADIVADGKLDPTLLIPGALLAAVSVAAAYWRYTTKDIR